ncbi:MAG: hypothetical protein Q7R80_00740 [bacterium]|nr:hypothetical protein [bacterium]
MSFTWKHGAIIAGFLVVGVAGAAILAQEPPAGGVRIATVASDDPFEAPPAMTNTAPVNASPVNAAPTVGSPVEEPSEAAMEPIAIFACKNRSGDARRPIQCDGRRQVHAWLTVALKKKLSAPATITLGEYEEALLANTEAPRATGRYIHVGSDIDIRAAKGATIRITYTASELRAWSIAAKKLAIAAYDVPTGRWIILPSVVNQRNKFVQAGFATKRLPNQLFALVTKP